MDELQRLTWPWRPLADSQLLVDGEQFYPHMLAGIDNARFKRPVEPGDQLVLEVTLGRAKAGIYKFAAKALVGDQLAAEAELMCTMRRIAA